MARVLVMLDLSSPDREQAKERMEKQLRNAREWRDVINTFFYKLSGVKDAHGRTIYE